MSRDDASEHGRIADVIIQELFDFQEERRIVRKPTTQERILAKQTAYVRPHGEKVEKAKHRALKKTLVENRDDLARIFDGVVSASGKKPYFTVFVTACAEAYKADYEDICMSDRELEGGGPANVWSGYACSEENWIGPFLARSGRHFKTYAQGHVVKPLGELFQDYCRIGLASLAQEAFDHGVILAPLSDMNDESMEVILSPFPFHMSM